jgi:hypothetical protein
MKVETEYAQRSYVRQNSQSWSQIWDRLKYTVWLNVCKIWFIRVYNLSSELCARTLCHFVIYLRTTFSLVTCRASVERIVVIHWLGAVWDRAILKYYLGLILGTGKKITERVIEYPAFRLRFTWIPTTQPRHTDTKLNSVAVSPQANYIPSERPPLVGEVSANFCG